MIGDASHSGPWTVESAKAWWAALLDGEGSIVIRKRKGLHVPFPAVVVYNTNKELLETTSSLLDFMFGAEIGRGVAGPYEQHVGTMGTKPYYCLWVSTRISRALIPELLPYLIVKRQRALEVLALPYPRTKQEVSKIGYKARMAKRGV